jgi:Ca2+/Na+ antiporter
MAEEHLWNRNRACLFSISIPFVGGFLLKLFAPVVTLSMDNFSKSYNYENANKAMIVCIILLVPGIIISLLIKFRTSSDSPPKIILFLFALIAFIMSLLWIKFTCDIIIEFITLLGLILKLEKAVLGFTLLSWGNVLGDLMANIAMSKRGLGEMAISSCIPNFDLIVGFGVSTLIKITDTGEPI